MYSGVSRTEKLCIAKGRAMAVIDVRIDITGMTPLLMHSDRLADPLLPESKAFKRVTSKRTKTDADYEDMARMEYLAGLYTDPDTGAVSIPGRNLMKCLIEGARVTKSGPKVERGCVIGADFPLGYNGPTDPEKLYADKNFVSRMTVKVGTARTIRCRPIFRSWTLTATGIIDEAVLSADELSDIARNAGSLVGLGDYRKGGGFGRFSAVVTATGVR
jgi:hypothetical protein